MIYPDLLVHLETYPDALPDAAVDKVAALAVALGGGGTAISPHVRIPLKGARLASFALKLDDLARSEEARARQNADHLAARFAAAVEAGGGASTAVHPACELFEIGEVTARLARTRDLTLLPVAGEAGAHLSVAEALLFSSGRPALLFRADGAGPPSGLENVMVAWDGSAPAARAVMAAMPVLKAAKSVTILSILNEKAGVSEEQGEDLVRHLARHGVSASKLSFDAAGATIGSVLEHVCARQQVDLLVMGAFGHSRARQFILGGATRSVLEAPPAPVLLAH
ncbi:universal stress protein [Phenylobacterium sp.]|uniref:universal stress protein n=1 Tax=Phenylobacterium sp. TaxID=1871053 RepID=UPI002FD986FE